MARENDIIPPDLPQLQTSLSRVTTAAHLLDGFAHRNKNQHRGAQWWGPFDMLRRSLRKMLPDLEGAVQRAELLSSSAELTRAAKRRRTGKDSTGAATKQPELERAAERARWIHDVVGTKAYEAFTQLAADKQFAQLGLALIGVLAQAMMAMALFVRDESETVHVDAPDLLGSTHDSGLKGEAPSGVAHASTSADDRDDPGVAVSRDELEGDNEPSMTKRPAPSLKRPSAKEEYPSKISIKMGKKAKVDDGLARAGREPEPRKTDLEDSKKIKKKKRRKGGGDEFDDLFSSLI